MVLASFIFHMVGAFHKNTVLNESHNNKGVLVTRETCLLIRADIYASVSVRGHDCSISKCFINRV